MKGLIFSELPFLLIEDFFFDILCFSYQIFHKFISNLPKLSNNIIILCIYCLKESTIINFYYPGLFYCFPIISKTLFFIFDMFDNIRFLTIRKAKNKYKVLSNSFIKEIHDTLKNISMVNCNSCIWRFHQKKNQMYLIDLIFKKILNFLNSLLIHLDSIRISKSRSINNSIKVIVSYISNVIIWYIFSDAFELWLSIFNYNKVTKWVLKLNSRQVIHKWVQKCRFSTSCLSKNNQGF